MSKFRDLTSHFGQDNVEPISQENRTLKFFAIFSLWVGAAVIVTTVYTGMLLVPDLSYSSAFWVIFLGSFIGAFFLIAVGSIGTRTGLPTLVLTRGSFGHRGASLPSAAIMLMYTGWTFIQSYMAALSLDYAFFYIFGYSNINLFVLITAILTVLIVMFGYRGVVKSEKMVAGMMLIFALIVFGYMFIAYDVTPLISMEGSQTPAINSLIGFDIVFVTVFTFMALVADYNRYAISNKVGMIATFFGYNVGNIIALLLGITVVGFAILKNSPITYDPTILIAKDNSVVSLIAALVVFFSVLTTNVMVVYSATMAYLAIFNKHKFWIPALIIGIVTVFGALLKEWLLENFADWLILSGVVFIPLVSILLADYFIVKKGKYDAQEIIDGTKKTYWYLGGINYAAYLTFILGTAFAYYFSFVYVLPTGTTLFAFILSVVLYLVLEKIQRKITSSS
jgi:NCS1 family nucleobase:cation symporter-1